MLAEYNLINIFSFLLQVSSPRLLYTQVNLILKKFSDHLEGGEGVGRIHEG